MPAAPSSVAASAPPIGRGVTLFGAVVNLVLSGLKLAAGIVADSSVMVADAVHSLTDFGSDIVTLVALGATAKPPDASHPYGHGRFETVGTVILALLLLGAVAGILYDAYGRFGEPSAPGVLAAWAAGLSIVVKEALYHIAVRVGRRHASPLLIANAWHHRSDAFSSVAALGGILGARMGWPVLDPVAAVLVAVLIGHVAIKLLGDVFREVTVGALPGPVLARMRAGIERLPGVVSLHELRARRMGRSVLVDLHVQVDEATTVSDGHQVAERVRKFVFDANGEVSEVLVHIDPEPDENLAPGQSLTTPRQEIEAQVRRVARELPAVREVTHVHTHFLRGRIGVQVHIVVDPDQTIRAAGAVAGDLRARLEALTEVDHADVHLDLHPAARR
ncbi:MAG: cation diffusion facilitator family transporter [Planctomycetota bacterium]